MRIIELLLIIKPGIDARDCLKRVANVVWNDEGVVKKLQFLGHRKLPYRLPSAHEEFVFYHEGNYFLYHLALKTTRFGLLRKELKLDMDILQTSINIADESKIPADYKCTLEEEFKTAPFRKSVKPLLDDRNVLAEVRR